MKGSVYDVNIINSFAILIHEFSTLVSERGTSSRGIPSHFMMRGKLHMSCFVITVLP